MKPKTQGGECIFKPLFFSQHGVPAAKSLKLNHLCQIRGLATLSRGGQGASGGTESSLG